MNPPQWDDLDYIHFLIAAQKVFTGTEAARCAPEEERAPAHDAFTRLLPRPPPDTEALWQEAKAFVDVGKGLLVLDDPTLDKPYAQKMDLGDRSLEWPASAGGPRDRAFDLALDGGEGPPSL
jgi:putative transposase